MDFLNIQELKIGLGATGLGRGGSPGEQEEVEVSIKTAG